MKKKILICGATGFIGRNIAEHFSKDDRYEVYGTYFRSQPYHNPKVNLVKADLTDINDINKVVANMDIIIQAAATTSGANEIINKPYYHVTDNAVMNSLLFRAAYEHKISHVVFFSCTVMYQTLDQPFVDSPVRECDFDANKQIFPSYFGVGWTKVYLEKVCEFYSRISNTKYTVLRHSNIYGHHDKFDLQRSHVFGATMAKVLTAKDGKIVVWGAGEEERDLLYISDLVRFVDIAIDKQESKYELVNVGSGKALSVRNLVEKIIEITGRDIKAEYDLTKPTIKTKSCLAITKAAGTFGWHPEVSIENGIRRTMDWCVSNIFPNKGGISDNQ